MNPILEACIAGVSAIAGFLLGKFFTRLGRPWWALGYLLALALVIAFAFTVHFATLSVVPPFSWLFLGHKKYAVMAFMTTLVLTTPLSRLPRKQDRTAIGLLMVVVICVMSIKPCLAPLFDRHELEHLKTFVGRGGVCMQSTGYTCGPASAVTALRKLGLPAEEGRIAILSNTSSSGGTPDDELAEALQKEYGKEGLISEFRVFKDIAELKQAGLTLAVVKYGLFVDHFVTVLQVTDSEVIVGDPLGGLQHLSYAEFLEKWRYEGVVLKRWSQ